jgi:hypothetical protein
LAAFALAVMWPLKDKNTLTQPERSDKPDLIEPCREMHHALGTIVPVNILPQMRALGIG